MAPDDVPSVKPEDELLAQGLPDRAAGLPFEHDTALPPAPEKHPDVELYQGRYVMGPPLGKGGMSTVYRAWDTDLQRYVAIKRLEPPLSLDPHAKARFNREGKAIARLSHPNLVTLIDRGSTETEEYLVFQYIHGRSLKELITASGPLEIEDAGQIAGQAAEGLAQAHLAGIVHRDVEPQNILLDAEGRVKLIDFGIATGEDWTRVTREGSIVGSSRYMSPEQVQGRPVDQRTDVYSLGIVMYEMLAGEPPFQGTTVVEIGRQHVRDRARPLVEVRPEIPAAVDRIVLRCLQKLPESRFESMDALVGALIGLDLYRPQHSSSGVLGTLRRSVLGGARPDTLSDSEEWVPPPGTYDDEPPDEAVVSAAARGAGHTTDRGEGAPVRRTDLKRERRQDKRMERTRRRPSPGRARRLATWGLALAALVGMVAVLWILLAGGSTAPDLVGKTLDEAKVVAAEAGLEIEVDAEQQLAPHSPAGTVFSQQPAVGEEVPDDVMHVVVTRTPIAIPVTSTDDVDPQGDDEERADLLPLLVDGDEATAWSTESYKGETFGTIDKEGVGVSFELESPATVLEVTSPQKGWGAKVQVSAADGELQTVAELTGSTSQTVELGDPVQSGRIWITKLAPAGEGLYNVKISELRFFR